MIRVVVADDHALVRQGLVGLLKDEPGIDVVADAHTGEEAVQAVLKHRPDVALLDVRMPGIGGIGATREIMKAVPEVAVVLLTIYEDEELIFEGISAGARAYLMKDCPPEQLIATIKDVSAGGAFVSPEPLRRLLEKFQYLQRKAPQERTDASSLLSPREIEVLNCVVDGFSNKQIATRLSIDETTVKTHLHRIFEKLDVRDRTQAAIYALQQGWFDPPTQFGG